MSFDSYGDAQGAMDVGAAAPFWNSDAELLRSPTQQQQQDDFIELQPQHQQLAYAPMQPPAHLFATPSNPFHSALFEVEGDLNHVNPSEHAAAYARRAQQQQPFHPISQPSLQQQRGTTGDSSFNFLNAQASSSPIGLLSTNDVDGLDLDTSMGFGGGGVNNVSDVGIGAIPSAYDSLIDQAEQQAKGSRKRARGATGAPQPPAAAAYGEDLNLQASTFPVYGAVPQQPLHSIAAAPAASAGGGRDLRTRVPPAARPDSSAAVSHSSGGDSPTPAASAAARHDDSPVTPVSKGIVKKEKHQLTDRQRRAKIKESMDALREQLPAEQRSKADQATIVASSVQLMRSLKDEVQELREKLQQLEMKDAQEASKLDSRRLAIADYNSHRTPTLHSGAGVGPDGLKRENQMPPLSNSPFTSMMASLNGAGVSLWRMGLNGALLEVNLVFELVSGFSAREVLGRTPCHAPLLASLSIMPAAFLKAFSQAGGGGGHQQQQQQQLTPERGGSSSSAATTPLPNLLPSTPNSDQSSNTPSPMLDLPLPPMHPAPSAAASLGDRDCIPPDVNAQNTSINESSIAPSHGDSPSQTSVAPLYANASISHFPIVPQASLQNFFPYKCKTLIEAAAHAGVTTQPQPHGNFLVNHLAALPPNRVLKLLARHHTLWGEVLESIVTLCLVRDDKGNPDHIILLSTPDCRRLLTPATHQASPFMQQQHHSPSPQVLSKDNIADAEVIYNASY